MDNKNKKIITILGVLTIIFTIAGGTLAVWNWQTEVEQRTLVTFTATNDFSCSADGGGDINAGDVILIPTKVNANTSANYIKRLVQVKPQPNTDIKIYLDLWLDIKLLDSGLANSDNFRYSFTKGSASPEDGVITKGNFKGLEANRDKVMLLENIDYEEETTETYYLWIWLDEAETSTDTMNQNFRFELGGVCTDLPPEPYEAPVIKDGLIPVTIANNGAVTTISKTDPNWYSYGNKEWANAILVTDSSRSKYLNTNNVPVTESDILAYFVWIPRYAYKIWTTDATTTTSPQEIGIRWERSNQEYTNGLQVGEYRTHPAFWWDTDGDRQIDNGETISGIWVGKFETTGDATTPTIKPRTTPLVNQTISEQFDMALKFNGSSLTNKRTITYGTGTSQYGLTSANYDSHMMKNSEWGAVAYLSHSIYGINTEIRKNNYNNGEQAGCGASYELRNSADTVTTCAIPYGESTAYPQSTTENITGIFDMSGGKWDRVMGNYANTEVNGEFDVTVGTGFFAQLNNQKYYDYYNFDAVTSCTITTCGGHALFETKSWYNDYAVFVLSNAPWLIRSGRYDFDSADGVFYSNKNTGRATSNDGFRVVLF